MKRTAVLLLIVFSFFCLPVSTTALADAVGDEGKTVVSLGANLSADQKEQILKLFGVKREEAEIIEVTNQEERSYLEGMVSDKKIGNRAISSAYVEVLGEGRGILVETHNINWVTREMYANAMATAGVENAHVIAAAPFSVSGTAALTGVMKAFEKATGEKLSEEGKKAANEELVTTGELGEDIGKDKAASLVKGVKERVVREKVKDPEKIRDIIIDVAGDLNINITQQNMDQLADLMEKISHLDLNVDQISGQLQNISRGLDKVGQTINENKGIFQQILDAIKGFFAWLARVFKGKTA
ncbi:DUF1002 domain-containing protein [Eubacteriales bacterium mix99]